MVSSYVSLLEKRIGSDLDDRSRRYIDHAVSGAGRMRQMMEDLLELSRVGEALGPPDTVHVDPCLDEALEMLAIQIREQEATIDRPETLPEVRAHAPRVTRLLGNLVSNGLKYSTEAPKITIGVKREGDWWRISVADEGVGIAPEHHGVIWDVFRRLHTHDEIPGSGIGLSICRRIVEGWKGEISFTSAPGEGSTFVFTVPAADAPTDTSAR